MNHKQPIQRCCDCTRDELRTLYDIAQILLSESKQATIFEQVLSVIESHLNMVRGTIMLLLPDNTELVIQAASDKFNRAKECIRYQRGEGITGKVVETGNPVVVPDINAEPLFQNRIHRRQGKIERQTSFICVPVILEKEVVGTFSADLPYPLRTTLDQGKRTMSIIAAMIAGYLRTQRLLHLEREMWQNETASLRRQFEQTDRPANLIGVSGGMRDVFARIKILAHSDTTVLIRGPSGTGKELVASAIHYQSKRCNGPFIKVNCAALTESLIESELFGHEKGAFSGAIFSRKGRIEEADGGTLFLDEFGDVSLTTQVKLLRVIQERSFEKVGSNETHCADIRLIFATNRDLEAAVEQKLFREDLYYRINVFPVFLPALSERKEDIMPLVNHFLGRFSKNMNKPITRISTPAINMLMAYHWPGNIRELENCIEYAVLLSTDGVIYGHNLPPTLQTPDQTNMTATGGMRLRVMALERDMIVDALKRTNGNVSAAAKELQITPRMVRYKIGQLGIKIKQLLRP